MGVLRLHRARSIRRPGLTARLVVAGVAASLALAGPPSAATARPAPAPAGATTPSAATAPAAPSPSHESEFVARINGLRASKGLSQLQVSGDLLSVARRWTERMAAAGGISHNPNLANEVPGAWTKLGENVGVGNDIDGLMQAFIDSPAHYRNLVDPSWTHVAVGVTLAGGRMWTTHNFMTLESAPPPPPPPPPPSGDVPEDPPSSGAPGGAPGSGSDPAATGTPAAGDLPVTGTAASATPAAEARRATDRVTAVLDPLRSLEP